jgi:hypothetical protein
MDTEDGAAFPTNSGGIGGGQVITKTMTMTVTVISMGDKLMEKEAR